MKRLEKFLRPYRRESILAPLFKLLEVVFDLMVPVVIAQIIDVGVAKNDRGYIVEMFFVLLLMAAVGLLCSFTAQFFAAKASVGFATSVRQAMFDHIQGLSFTELDTLGTDTLITRLTDDVNQVQNGINMGLRLLLRSPFVVIGAMVMAFTINDLCSDSTDPVCRCIFDYADQYSAVQESTGRSGPCDRTYERESDRCPCHPCILQGRTVGGRIRRRKQRTYKIE